MSTAQQLWPEGYYDIDGLIGAEFGEINGKDSCKLTFQLSRGQGTKDVLLFFTGGENDRISFEQLGKLGWDGNSSKPSFSNPTAFQQLKCEHFNGKKGRQEGWRLAGGIAPLPADRSKRLESLFRSTNKTPAPAGRPASPPPASRPTQPPAPSTPPASAPVSAPPPSAPVQAPPAAVSHTKETAWAAWEKTAQDRHKQNPTLPPTPDVNAWCQARDKLMADLSKHEADWGPAEWEKMADIGDIPF